MTIDELFRSSFDISDSIDQNVVNLRKKYQYNNIEEDELPETNFSLIKEVAEILDNYYKQFIEALSTSQKDIIVDKCGFNDFEYENFIKICFKNDIDFNLVYHKFSNLENLQDFKDDLKSIIKSTKLVSEHEFRDYVMDNINNCSPIQLWLYYMMIWNNQECNFFRAIKKPDYMISSPRKNIFNFMAKIKENILSKQDQTIESILSGLKPSEKSAVLYQAELCLMNDALQLVLDKMADNTKNANIITITDKRTLKSPLDPSPDKISKFKEFIEKAINNGYDKIVLSRYSLEKVLKMADSMSESIMLKIAHEVSSNMPTLKFDIIEQY